MNKKRTKLERFWLRLKVAFKLVFKSKHGFVVYISEDQLVKLIKSEDVGDVTLSYYGIMEHQMGEVVKILADNINDVDIICAKGEFQAEVITQIQAKKE